MTTRINFNIDTKLKAAAIRKAKKIGLPLSTVLTQATRAFVEEDMQIGFFSPALLNDIGQARDDIRHGRMLFHDDLVKELRSADN
jgi:antitoxin component of RelBE/YafQ-DinJ toxin-antitoxin module